MSGLFGYISEKTVCYKKLLQLAEATEFRGQNSSAFAYFDDSKNAYNVLKTKKEISKSVNNTILKSSKILVAYSGLNFAVSNSIQPVVNESFILFHSGIVLNVPIDTENHSVSTPSNTDFIVDLIANEVNAGKSYEDAIEKAFIELTGDFSCVLIVPKLGKLFLFTNCKNIFYALDSSGLFFASEYDALIQLDLENITQLQKIAVFDVPSSNLEIENNKGLARNSNSKVINPYDGDISLLTYKAHNLLRCTRCILPETMPFIKFDNKGVCNYCHNYKIRNTPKPKDEFHRLVENYRKKDGTDDCVVPFSGGRDSCFTLHVIVKELKLKPITYTYDWGMVTDVGRRNISLMCGSLGLENIVVAADIEKKRRNIAHNFKAWLKNPDLGMLNILTAGDKHFFKYVDKVKAQTGIDLNIWGVNPLEVTHFKAGFLDIEPDFEVSKVYSNGALNQIRYQAKRLKAMSKSPRYFNSSIWDTVSGEYHRSVTKKSDYFHLFDYWQWDENEINGVLDSYNWERATDTSTTWRIGDGTAGIYNYIYYTLAGFTEHDTFRSNQVREGQITREEALRLVETENAPCYDNLRWYLKSINFDFDTTIKHINSIPRLHEKLY